MKVLVTGSEGFFGGFLVPALEGAGHEVVRYDLKLGLDILDRRRLAAKMRGCEGVVHLAGYPHYDPGIPEEDFYRAIVKGTESVALSFLRSSTARVLVHISTGAVYGFSSQHMDGWISEDDLPLTEELTSLDRRFLNSYSGNKYEAESLLRRLWETTERLWEAAESLEASEEAGAKAIAILRPNCIEPHDFGARTRGDHFGWWCKQETIQRAVLAALTIEDPTFLVVNVGEPNPNLDLTKLGELLGRLS